MYGWGATSFTRPESHTPHQVPLAYFKGPSGVSLMVDIIDTGKGTGIYKVNRLVSYLFNFINYLITICIYIAEREVDYSENDNGALFLPLNPASTTSVTFRPDNIALEPNETIVFDLRLVAVTPIARSSEFNAALPNAFFQQRIVFNIEDKTGNCI